MGDEANDNAKHQIAESRYTIVKSKIKIPDFWAIALYVISFISLVVVCTMEESDVHSSNIRKKTMRSEIEFSFANLLNIPIGIYISLFSFTFSLIFIFWICEYYPKTAIYGALFSPIMVILTGAIINDTYLPIIGGIVLVFNMMLFIIYIWGYVEYSSKMLHFSAHIIKKHIYELIFAIIAQFLLNIVIIGTVLYNYNNLCFDSRIIILCAFILVYWTINIGYYMVQVIVSAIVTYYIMAESGKDKKTVFSNSLHNTLYSLGSISFGALINDFMKILKIVAIFVPKKRNIMHMYGKVSLKTLILADLLDMFDNIFIMLNNFVYSYAAVSNRSYIQSMQDSYDGIESDRAKAQTARGTTGKISFIFTLGYFLVSLLIFSTFFLITNGSFFKKEEDDSVNPANFSITPDLLIPSIGFTILYFILMNMLSSGVLGLIFCKLELPDQLKTNYPEIYECLEKKQNI